MLFNCIVSCFFYSFVVPASGDPYSLNTTCVNVDSFNNQSEFQKEIGTNLTTTEFTMGLL